MLTATVSGALPPELIQRLVVVLLLLVVLAAAWGLQNARPDGLREGPVHLSTVESSESCGNKQLGHSASNKERSAVAHLAKKKITPHDPPGGGQSCGLVTPS
jgi:hypothetical protein